ncbi:MAG: transcriptional regulator [Gammaproteobacteria bacterium]|nr:transcriptional regulator [Gammaproteobacteria bacterium]
MPALNVATADDWKADSAKAVKERPVRFAARFPLLSWTAFITLMIMLALAYGWSMRDRHYLTAETGVGYWLGIAGGVLMFLQLAYTFRKKLGFMRRWGRVKYWFQIHMFIGVFAPVLIMFHANFGLGSMNSNIALFSMLLVVFSGIVGRYIYSKIHLGLYGRRATLQDVQTAFARQQHVMHEIVAADPAFEERLHRIEKRLVNHGMSLFGQIFTAPFLPLRILGYRFMLRRRMNKILRRLAVERGWTSLKRHAKRRQAGRVINGYLYSLRGVVEFALYTRLFALWHVLHIPLFTMMVLSGIVHVIAVHMY